MQAPPGTTVTDNRPVLAVLGDSLAEGYGVGPGQSYPDRLQQLLDSRGHKYRVVNFGVSGDTTTGGLGRIDEVLASKPAVVLVELGGNDGLRGVPVPSIRANLEAMIERFRSAGIRVVLAGTSLPPNYGAKYVRDFENAYKEIARKYRIALVPFVFEDIQGQLAARGSTLMQQDGIHPTAEGHQLMARTIFRYLEPALTP